MCGIIGYLSKDELKNISLGIKKIKHRGPDFQKVNVFHLKGMNLGFGHARLSIIDIDDRSNQPYFSKNKEFCLIYNGEIYNYQILRKELISKFNIKFRTNSDTEVLLEFLIKYGVPGLKRLEGMFAFAFFDKSSRRILLVRDKLGIKPLYYYLSRDKKEILWSSELKGIWSMLGKKAPIDDQVWAEYLSAGFIYEPDTGYKNTFKVQAGHYLEINFNNNPPLIKENEYWRPKIIRSKKKLEQKILSSINDHLVSDVPIGQFFSGGIDSSIILSATKESIAPLIVRANQQEVKKAGFTSDYEYGKKIANFLDVSLNEVELAYKENEPNEFLNSIEHVVDIIEEPIADYTTIVSELISKKAKEKGFTVMLSGMGADEIFGGYPRYQLIKYGAILKLFWPFIIPFIRNSPYFKKKIERFNNFFNSKGFAESYQSLLTPFSKKEIFNLLKNKNGLKKFEEKLYEIYKKNKNNSKIKTAMKMDIRGFLSHNFLVADKSSMQASLELRVPLATGELFELTLSLPDRKLLTIFHRKVVLRRLLLKSLPKSLVDRRKAGFHPPLDSKINDLGPEKILFYIEKNGLKDVLNISEIKKIINDHFYKGINNTFKIYRLLFISAWYAKNK